MDLDREIGRAWDALADADDATRVARILDVAGLFEQSADAGANLPESDRMIGKLLHLIADADLVATGQLSRRWVACDIHPLVEDAINRMAGERDLNRRAELLEDLWRAIPDDQAAEAIGCMPYAPGMVGWRREERMPTSATWKGFIGAVGVAWRQRRAS